MKWVLSIDLLQNDDADANVLVSPTSDWLQQGKEARKSSQLKCFYCLSEQLEVKVEEVLKEDKLDAIVCVAGGWAGGNASSSGINQKC